MLGEGGEGPADLANYDHEAPVLHVLVVGFHHKKGCQVKTAGILFFKTLFFQVEFSHPPLVPGGEAISPQVDEPSQFECSLEHFTSQGALSMAESALPGPSRWQSQLVR